mmetsp:Transcript_209/g.626  ORF Transcript_209/g.626 Transcript_209/m.626 type:complete len:171 (-) Transcript_209:201-713(-)
MSILLAPPTHQNYHQLEVINNAVLPVQFSTDFYKNLHKNDDFSRIAFVSGDLAVGGVTARKEGSSVLYIVSLAVLAPYRRIGVASTLLSYLESTATRSICQVGETVIVRVHVAVGDEDAQSFYKARGFSKVGDVVENFYKRGVTPPHAVVFEKEVTVTAAPAKAKPAKKD